MEPHFETCRWCKFEGPHRVELTPHLSHYAKVVCAGDGCARILRWLPKPDSDHTKYRRPKSHLDLVERYSRGFCEMCLRKTDELGARQILKAHHVQEYQDQGDPSRENIWILCTACHQLVHWVRCYHGKDLTGLVEATVKATEDA